MAEFSGIYYEIHGSGEPLILTNGIMMSFESWRWHIEYFKRYFTVIVFDFAGQGRTKREFKVLDDQVEVLSDLMKHLGFEKYHLLGLSYGGQVVLRYVEKYGEMINKLVLSNTCSKVDNFLLSVGKVWKYGSKDYDPVAFFDLALPFVYGKTFYNNNYSFLEQRKEAFKTLLKKEWFEDFIKLTESNEDFEIKDFSKFTFPTLLIASDEDIVTPYKEMKELSKSIKNSELVLLNDAGHGVFLEKKELWSSIITGFLLG